jgi:hypothetical protein
MGFPKPGPEYVVDHIDNNPENNRMENLRWVTKLENSNNPNNLKRGPKKGRNERNREENLRILGLGTPLE